MVTSCQSGGTPLFIIRIFYKVNIIKHNNSFLFFLKPGVDESDDLILFEQKGFLCSSDDSVFSSSSERCSRYHDVSFKPGDQDSQGVERQPVV